MQKNKKGMAMKKAKKLGAGIGIIIIVIALYGVYRFLSGWTIRYRSELDDFFGEGNWEVISEETKKDRKDYVRRENIFGETSGQKKKVGFYREWDIQFENKDGEDEIWKLSTHTYVYNHERYSFFNPKRYSGKNALTLELMEISFAVVEEEVHNNIVKQGLTDEEAQCIYVDMSYRDGNPPPSFYDDLADEDWFNIEGVTAGNYLATDLYDFYLHIGVHEYRIEQLSEEEQDNVKDSLDDIAKRLLEAYGNNASFEINYDGYKVEYDDGEKVDS